MYPNSLQLELVYYFFFFGLLSCVRRHSQIYIFFLPFFSARPERSRWRDALEWLRGWRDGVSILSPDISFQLALERDVFESQFIELARAEELISYVIVLLHLLFDSFCLFFLLTTSSIMASKERCGAGERVEDVLRKRFQFSFLFLFSHHSVVYSPDPSPIPLHGGNAPAGDPKDAKGKQKKSKK